MTTRLILLPGLGADARMFDPLREAGLDFESPAWIAPRATERLTEYAARFAEKIRSEEPVVLGGASLGGMVALEMARHLRPLSVVLLSSCRSPQAIRPALRRLGKASTAIRNAPVVPAFVAGSWLAHWLGASTAEAARNVRAMFADASPEFVRWGLRAVLEWEGCPDPGVPVRHLHGGKDLLIPATRVTADLVVPGAGHVPSLTHPEAVSLFLREAVA
ncbi:MAG TPA: alpha/beta fold hydrolase [Thermoanaerobaculia bacterium]|jgi:pimeloyl-ACP methyl ester carboxylesterase